MHFRNGNVVELKKLSHKRKREVLSKMNRVLKMILALNQILEYNLEVLTRQIRILTKKSLIVE